MAIKIKRIRHHQARTRIMTLAAGLLEESAAIDKGKEVTAESTKKILSEISQILFGIHGLLE